MDIRNRSVRRARRSSLPRRPPYGRVRRMHDDASQETSHSMMPPAEVSDEQLCLYLFLSRRGRASPCQGVFRFLFPFLWSFLFRSLLPLEGAFCRIFYAPLAYTAERS